jgi:hypothetical protein
MLNKIALGVVLASISAGLVYGAVIRTESRATVGISANEGSSVRNGRNQEVSEKVNTASVTGTRNGDQSGNGNGPGNADGAGQTDSRQLLQSLADVDEIFQYTGTVQDVSQDYLLLVTTDGDQIVIENRAWWYATDAGFKASQNDEIEVVGFYDEDGAFEVITIDNLTSGGSVQIREADGRPFWAGSGAGSGRN